MLRVFPFLLCIGILVVGELIEYNRHIVEPDSPEYLIIPKFAKSEVPHWRPGKGRSYIDLSRLYVQSMCSPDPNGPPGPFLPGPQSDGECKKAQFDLLMFEAPIDKPWQDYWTDDHYCCTDELVSEGL